MSQDDNLKIVRLIKKLYNRKTLKNELGFLGFQITSLDVGHPSYTDDPTSLATSKIIQHTSRKLKKTKNKKKWQILMYMYTLP
jgi:hypothetical protein